MVYVFFLAVPKRQIFLSNHFWQIWIQLILFLKLWWLMLWQTQLVFGSGQMFRRTLAIKTCPSGNLWRNVLFKLRNRQLIKLHFWQVHVGHLYNLAHWAPSCWDILFQVQQSSWMRLDVCKDIWHFIYFTPSKITVKIKTTCSWWLPTQHSRLTPMLWSTDSNVWCC